MQFQSERPGVGLTDIGRRKREYLSTVISTLQQTQDQNASNCLSHVEHIADTGVVNVRVKRNSTKPSDIRL